MRQQAVGVSRPSLDRYGISEQLERYNYPRKALLKFRRCGDPTTNYIIRSCGCGTYAVPLKVRCDNKFCQRCSKARFLRLKNRLLPYLSQYPNNWTHTWKFLTFSPKSYKSYEKGKKALRDGWKRFLRLVYSYNKDGSVKFTVRDVIKGGFMVVEVTKKDTDLWHFHIHAIIYSRFVDNRYRGHCVHCNQNYLKYDRNSKKFYCANRKCNHIFEGVITPTTLNVLAVSAFRRPVMCDISQSGNPSRVLNYMLGYITVQKDSFTNEEDYIHHVAHSFKDRLITSFGEFYNFKKKIIPDPLKLFVARCRCCGEVPTYQFDAEVSNMLFDASKDPPPPISWF